MQQRVSIANYERLLCTARVCRELQVSVANYGCLLQTTGVYRKLRICVANRRCLSRTAAVHYKLRMSVTNNKYLSQAAIVCCILRAFTANNRCPNRLKTTGICGKQRVSVATAIISCNEGCLEVVLWTYLASWTQDRITAH